MPGCCTDLSNTLTQQHSLCWLCKQTSSPYLKTSSKLVTISSPHPFVDCNPTDLHHQYMKYSHLMTVILIEKAEAQRWYWLRKMETDKYELSIILDAGYKCFSSSELWLVMIGKSLQQVAADAIQCILHDCWAPLLYPSLEFQPNCVIISSQSHNFCLQKMDFCVHPLQLPYSVMVMCQTKT